MKKSIKYDRHEDEYEECLTNENKKKIADTWMEKGSLDRWRHERMLKLLDPIFKDKTLKWLTIGDGRYGNDANYILEKGCDVHATDISDKLLKIGSEKGFIKSYSAENAENLNFEDETFDYVLIKEAFHHLPRPWMGLYEAFRVCRKGVILIEPTDKNGLYKYLSNFLKVILGRKNFFHTFEEVGNYVYSVNSLELEKFLLGMHYRDIAMNQIIDSYIPGIEKIKMRTKNPRERFIILRLKLQILFKQILRILKIGHKGLIVAILFKEPPNNKFVKDMEQTKWLFKKLPKNPFI